VTSLVDDPIKGSFTPKFYEQLLCAKIPKAQKDTVFLSFWDLHSQKLHVNMLVKSILGRLIPESEMAQGHS